MPWLWYIWKGERYQIGHVAGTRLEHPRCVHDLPVGRRRPVPADGRVVPGVVRKLDTVGRGVRRRLRRHLRTKAEEGCVQVVGHKRVDERLHLLGAHVVDGEGDCPAVGDDSDHELVPVGDRPVGQGVATRRNRPSGSGSRRLRARGRGNGVGKRSLGTRRRGAAGRQEQQAREDDDQDLAHLTSRVFGARGGTRRLRPASEHHMPPTGRNRTDIRPEGLPVRWRQQVRCQSSASPGSHARSQP